MRDVISTSTSLSSHSSSLLIPSLLKQRSYVRLLVSNIAFKLARRDSGKTKLSRLRTQGTKPSQTLSSIICPEIRNLVETHFFLISRWKITLFLVLNSILRQYDTYRFIIRLASRSNNLTKWTRSKEFSYLVFRKISWNWSKKRNEQSINWISQEVFSNNY